MKLIKSIQNEWIKQLKLLALKKGDFYPDYCLVEGQHLVEEAARAGLLEHRILSETVKITFLESDIVLAPFVGQALSQQKTWSGWFGLCKRPNPPQKLGTSYVYCDGIQDPGNLGTMIRTALAFGFSGMMMSEDCVDPWGSKALQSSQGASFFLPILRVTRAELITYQAKGFSILGTLLGNDTVSLTSFKAPTSFIVCLGHEGRGLSEEVQQILDHRLMIPIQHVDSLNVAIAFGIFAYSLLQTKKE